MRKSLGEIKWFRTHHLPVQWGTQTGPPNCQSCVLYSSDTLPLMNRIINEKRRHMIRSYSFLLFRMNGNKGKHFRNRQLETSFMQRPLELAKATFQGKKQKRNLFWSFESLNPQRICYKSSFHHVEPVWVIQPGSMELAGEEEALNFHLLCVGIISSAVPDSRINKANLQNKWQPL